MGTSADQSLRTSSVRYINPYKLFVGCFTPNWLASRREISPGAKLIYARLSQHAGRDGRCNPRQEILAAECGIGDRQVRRYIDDLERYHLIEVHQNGLNRANSYSFLWHQWMDISSDDVVSAPDRTDVSTPERTDTSGQGRTDTSGQGRTDTSGQGRTDTSGPFYIDSEENQRRESKREREDHAPDFSLDKPTTKAVATAFKTWVGEEPSAAFNETIRLLLSTGEAGARIPGRAYINQTFNGFTLKQVLAGIETMAMSRHFSPTALVKHVAGLIDQEKKSNANGKSAKNRPIGKDIGKSREQWKKRIGVLS